MADPISTPLEDARTRLREATDLLGCDPGMYAILWSLSSEMSLRL